MRPRLFDEHMLASNARRHATLQSALLTFAKLSLRDAARYVPSFIDFSLKRPSRAISPIKHSRSRRNLARASRRGAPRYEALRCGDVYCRATYADGPAFTNIIIRLFTPLRHEKAVA